MRISKLPLLFFLSVAILSLIMPTLLYSQKSKKSSKEEVEPVAVEPPKAAPKPLSSKSLAHLYILMSNEPPLAEIDMENYISHLPEILSLDMNPENVGKILEATGWTENRLAYVCVKIGLGLSGILDGENLRLRRYPLFVYPLQEEKELIALMEPELSKAFKATLRQVDQKNTGGSRKRSTRSNF